MSATWILNNSSPASPARNQVFDSNCRGFEEPFKIHALRLCKNWLKNKFLSKTRRQVPIRISIVYYLASYSSFISKTICRIITIDVIYRFLWILNIKMCLINLGTKLIFINITVRTNIPQFWLFRKTIPNFLLIGKKILFSLLNTRNIIWFCQTEAIKEKLFLLKNSFLLPSPRKSELRHKK